MLCTWRDEKLKGKFSCYAMQANFKLQGEPLSNVSTIMSTIKIIFVVGSHYRIRQKKRRRR
jgi:hypothetical protein